MDPDESNNDPDSFDCDTCDVANAYREVSQDSVNVQAWRLFQQIANRFTADTDSVGLAFDRLTRAYTDDDYIDMLQRMAILMETFHPHEQKDDT